MPDIAVRMLERLSWAAGRRDAILRRELSLRSAVEKSLDRLGGDAAPLWLRMEPLRLDDVSSDLSDVPYQLLDVRPDQRLVWAPDGTARVRTCDDVARHYAALYREHRLRTSRLARLNATGSKGWIGVVTLALLESEGLDPGRLFLRVREATLAGDLDAQHQIGGDGWNAVISWRNGALVAWINSDRGQYSEDKGQLVLWSGLFPLTVIAGVTGRRLVEFLGHPAFGTRRLRITRSRSTELGAVLQHRVQLTSFEAAVRRRPGIGVRTDGRATDATDGPPVQKIASAPTRR